MIRTMTKVEKMYKAVWAPGSGRIETARDFSATVDSYLWKRLKNDDEWKVSGYYLNLAIYNKHLFDISECIPKPIIIIIFVGINELM